MRVAVIIGAIWFQAIAFLIPQGDINQLSALPSLYSHYNNHQLQQEGISFTDFIILHYSPDSEHNDPGHHADLPFFQTAVAGMFMPAFFFPQLEPGAQMISERPSIYRDLYQFEFINLSFQPPRHS